MDNDILNKLTPSANQALDEITEEIKLKILEEAFTIALQKNLGDKEISLSDVLNAKDLILKEPQKKENLESKRRKFYYLVGVSGILYAIIGLFIFIYQNKNFNLSNDIGLIITALGLTISFFVLFYQQMIDRRYSINKSISNSRTDQETENFEIVKKWQVIERLARDIMLKNGYDENKSNSFNNIHKFINEQIDTPDNKEKLLALLKARNRILHDNLILGRDERLSLLKFSDDIIDLLEKKIK